MTDQRPAELDSTPSVVDLIEQAIGQVEAARSARLSNTVSVPKDELLAVLRQALDAVPAEIRSARYLLKQREEYLRSTNLECDEILALARSRAEHMVERHEVVKAAELRARRLVDEAETAARRIRIEVEDLCDSRLAELETLIDRVRLEVRHGRTAFAVPRRRPPAAADTEPAPRAPFDQDAV